MIKTRALVNAFLISLKACFASWVHFISLSFFSIFVIFLIISAQFIINLLRKFTLPIKDCTFFLFLGNEILKIPSTLAGSILIPSFYMMCPSILPSSTTKCDFFRFRETPNFIHFKNILSRCYKCNSFDAEKTVISSKYMTTNLSFSSAKAISIAL